VERAEAEAILDGDRERAVALLMRVGELVEPNRRLDARVAELERRLNRSSRKSSLPPLHDPPSAPPRPRQPASGRKRGGQPGHEGRNRPLLPLERVDQVVEHWPQRCHACARVFEEDERIDVAAVQRHQVAELPPVAVTVTEHRLHRLRCPPRREPSFPPASHALPSTRACRRLWRRSPSVTASRAATRPSSPASCSASSSRPARSTRSSTGPEKRSPARTPGSSRSSSRKLKSAPVVNIDETGWKTAGGNRTLWGALTARTAVFRIAAGRHAFEARALLGERFAGIVCSDRWRGYDYLDPTQRQLCWAHLARDFTAHSEGMAEQEDFGHAGLVIAHDLFAAWDRYRANADRARLQAQIAPLEDQLRALLEHAARKSPRTK
jgi:transposase